MIQPGIEPRSPGLLINILPTIHIHGNNTHSQYLRTHLRVLWIYDQQGHLAYVPGDFAKASLVHIASDNPMTCIDQEHTRLCVKSCLVGSTDEYLPH